LVGRNSNPSSAQGVSNFAVPGALVVVEANRKLSMDFWCRLLTDCDIWKEETNGKSAMTAEKQPINFILR
jgi:hypothetical protein